MEELKPCPFCGGKAFVRYIMYVMPCSAVQCSECGASTAVHSDEYEAEDGTPRAVEAWNRRMNND